MEESKPFWLSKTFWTNLVVGVLGLASADTVAENPEAAVGLVAFVNIVLRAITKGAIRLS